MLRRGLAALAVVAGLLAPAAGPAPPACAGDGPHAGLVIAHDERVLALCVALDAERVSGLRLIELAGLQYGLDHAFGYGGQAVCRLDGVGTASETCFEEDDPSYWAYFRLEGGRWVYSSLGAGSTLVEDGDVEGWAWGAGGPSSHPRPPLRSFADVCGAEDPDPGPPAEGGEEPGGAGAAPIAPPGSVPPPAPTATPGDRAPRGARPGPGGTDAPSRPGPRGGRPPGEGLPGPSGVRSVAAGGAASEAAGGADAPGSPWPAGAWASVALSSALLLLAARRARRSP